MLRPGAVGHRRINLPYPYFKLQKNKALITYGLEIEKEEIAPEMQSLKWLKLTLQIFIITALCDSETYK